MWRSFLLPRSPVIHVNILLAIKQWAVCTTNAALLLPRSALLCLVLRGCNTSATLGSPTPILTYRLQLVCCIELVAAPRLPQYLIDGVIQPCEALAKAALV